MTIRRGIAWFFVLVGVLLIGLVSYLAFVDLGRHKGRIESLVSDLTGRTFAIEGDLKFELLPSISLVAENAHLANADWGSKQPMVQVGRLALNVDFWSLISGPVDVRSFDLRDVTVLLERGRKDQSNWRFREPRPAGDETEVETKGSPLPIVIEEAKLRDVRVIYRERGKRDREVRLDRLTIAPGKAGLLALEGRGRLNEFPMTIDGEAGPLDSLLKGRDIRVDTKASVGRLALDIKGGFARLVPLEGADLAIQARGSDVDAMLTRLELPLIATGALKMDAKLSSEGELTRIRLDATAGDLAARANGTLSGLQLRGSTVKFEATAADAARLAGVFGIDGVPAAPLTASGSVRTLRKEFRFDDLRAGIPGVSARLDGKLLRGRDTGADLKFELGVEDLTVLHASMPRSKFSARGRFASNKEKIEVTELDGSLDENRFSGRASTTRTVPRRIEADIASPRIDLTPFLRERPETAPAAESDVKAKPRRKYVFGEEPLPMVELKGTEATVHVAVAELAIAKKTLKDVDVTGQVDSARVLLTARARGSLEGKVESSATLEPVGEGAAKFSLKFGLENVRAGLDMKDMASTDVPPLGVTIELAAQGRSARELASNANGLIILTQGPGKTKAEFLDAFGGNVFAELRSRLNPFRTQDPFTKLDCTVLRADIVDGAVDVKPIVLQTEKVTVVAQGKIDLHDEQLTLDFDTRPRKGIGVSPGMFANPFIRVEGTLANPRLAMGAKGMTSGAVAAATGGLSVLASGLLDRLKGGTDMCRKARERAMRPAISASAGSST